MAQNWISEAHGNEVRQKIIQMIGQANADGVPIHRAVLARELGVTRSTAGKHVDMLLAERKIREVNGRMLELVPARAKRAVKKAPAKKVAAAKKAAPLAKRTVVKKAAPVRKPVATKAKSNGKVTTAKKAPARKRTVKA